MAEPTTSSTMNVSLPEQLKRFVDAKVASGMYGSASEFVREAIREKMKREEEMREALVVLAAKVVEGLESGEPVDFTDSFTAQQKQAFLNRLRPGERAA